MAKNKKSRRRPANLAAGVATAGEDPGDARLHGSEDPGAALAAGGVGGSRGGQISNGQDEPHRGRGGSPFAVYKSGQGYYTRMATVVAGGLVAVFGAHHIYSHLASDNPVWQLGVPTLFLALCAAVIFWVVGINRRTNEFFIATEGEMKKVSWSSRREIIGSTKVVLAFTFVLGLLLFVIDVGFMAFFSWIGVLDINLLEAIGWKVNG